MPIVRSGNLQRAVDSPPARLGMTQPARSGTHALAALPLPHLLALLLLYILVRVVYWSTLTHIEEHDSVRYLLGVRGILELGFTGIVQLSADDGPVFPLFSALLAWPAGSVETGARLCSLAFQVGLFAAAVGIGRRIMNTRALLMGLSLLALSPVLIPLSVRIVTEPAYIGLVYVGLWIFWAQYRTPRWWTGALLGLVFGLALLTRIEALLFVAAVPVFQATHFRFGGQRSYRRADLVRWGAAFLLVYGLLGAAQVWRASTVMGGWALNGRQAWAALLSGDGGDNYEQAIYGLDFDPARTNLRAARSSPVVRDQLQGGIDPLSFIRLAVRNVDKIHTNLLGKLVGPVVPVFFAFGMLGLIRRRRYYAAFLVLAFIATALLLPLMQSVLVIRHLAVLVPILLLTAGKGVFVAADSFWPRRARHRLGWLLPAGFLMLVLAGWLIPLRDTFSGSAAQTDYDPRGLARAAEMVRPAEGGEGGRRALVAGRKAYFAWLANAEPLPLPYTDYQGLVTYLRLNRAEYLFLDHSQFHGRPLAERFQQPEPPPEFVLLYRTEDAAGRRIELYRFVPDGPTAGRTVEP